MSDSAKIKEPVCADDEHDWQFEAWDYYGDPSVPNGTVTFQHLVCRKCGDETFK